MILFCKPQHFFISTALIFGDKWNSGKEAWQSPSIDTLSNVIISATGFIPYVGTGLSLELAEGKKAAKIIGSEVYKFNYSIRNNPIDVLELLYSPTSVY